MLPLEVFTVDFERVFQIAWSLDGSKIAVSHDKSESIISILDVETGQTRFNLAGHTRSIRGLAWKPDGTELISGSDDGTVKRWNITEGKMIAIYNYLPSYPRYDDYPYEVMSVAWKSDGTQFASAYTDGKIIIWNADDATKPTILEHAPANWINWNADGSHFASAHEGNLVQLWHPQTFQRLAVFEEHVDDVQYGAWSPDGRYLATVAQDVDWDASSGPAIIDQSGFHVRIWDVEMLVTQQVIVGEGVYRLSWSPDGRRLALGTIVGHVLVYDILNGQLLSTFNCAPLTTAVAWNPDGTTLAYVVTPNVN